MSAASSPAEYPEARLPQDAQGLPYDMDHMDIDDAASPRELDNQAKRQRRLWLYNGPPIHVTDSPSEHASPASCCSSDDGFSLASGTNEHRHMEEIIPLGLSPKHRDDDVESNSSGFGLDDGHKDDATTHLMVLFPPPKDPLAPLSDAVSSAAGSPPQSPLSPLSEGSSSTAGFHTATPSSPAGFPNIPASWQSAEKEPRPSAAPRRIHPKETPDDERVEGCTPPVARRRYG